MSAAIRISAMGLDALLSRVDGVQRSGKGYRTRCPSCGGQSRKVSVSEADDGRVLVHCFGGCEPAAVVQAVGLQLADLFPVRLRPETPEERRAWRRAARASQWGAALVVLELEATIVLVAGRQIAGGEPLTPEDDQRLGAALERIQDAREVLRGR